MNNIIEDLVVQLSTDPFNPNLNFKCALEYERLNQTASAVSFYLRCAEYGFETHKILTYSSLSLSPNPCSTCQLNPSVSIFTTSITPWIFSSSRNVSILIAGTFISFKW